MGQAIAPALRVAVRPELKIVGDEQPRELRRLAERWLSGIDRKPEMPDCLARIEELATLYRLASSTTEATAAFALLQSMVFREVERALQRRGIDHAVLELATTIVQNVDLLDKAPSAYFTLDVDCRIISANRTAASWFLADQAILNGKAFVSLLGEDCKQPFLHWLTSIQADTFCETYELTIGSRDLCALAKRGVSPAGWLLMMINTTQGGS